VPESDITGLTTFEKNQLRCPYSVPNRFSFCQMARHIGVRALSQASRFLVINSSHSGTTPLILNQGFGTQIGKDSTLGDQIKIAATSVLLMTA
jgi:hypothetical protein